MEYELGKGNNIYGKSSLNMANSPKSVGLLRLAECLILWEI